MKLNNKDKNLLNFLTNSLDMLNRLNNLINKMISKKSIIIAKVGLHNYRILN